MDQCQLLIFSLQLLSLEHPMVSCHSVVHPILYLSHVLVITSSCTVVARSLCDNFLNNVYMVIMLNQKKTLTKS